MQPLINYPLSPNLKLLQNGEFNQLTIILTATSLSPLFRILQLYLLIIIAKK